MGNTSKILSTEKADPKAMTAIYKVVIQVVLLYGSESWVMNDTMKRRLQSFHSVSPCYIISQHIRQNADETWT